MPALSNRSLPQLKYILGTFSQYLTKVKEEGAFEEFVLHLTSPRF